MVSNHLWPIFPTGSVHLRVRVFRGVRARRGLRRRGGEERGHSVTGTQKRIQSSAQTDDRVLQARCRVPSHAVQNYGSEQRRGGRGGGGRSHRPFPNASLYPWLATTLLRMPAQQPHGGFVRSRSRMRRPRPHRRPAMAARRPHANLMAVCITVRSGGLGRCLE